MSFAPHLNFPCATPKSRKFGVALKLSTSLKYDNDDNREFCELGTKNVNLQVYGICYCPISKNADLKELGVDDSKVCLYTL